jgi:hypothetical protein
VFLFEPGLCGARHDFPQRFFHELRRQRLGTQAVQLAVQADARRIAGDEVQVRAAAAQHFLQELVDAMHGRRRAGRIQAGGRSGGFCAHDGSLVQPGAKSILGSMEVSVT